MTATMPEPGIYPAIPFATYLSWPAEHQSRLWHIINKTPMHYQEEVLRPRPPTDDMALGTAGHYAVLQPQVFETLYICEPPVPEGMKKWDRRTKGYKAAADEKRADTGKEFLEADEWEFLMRARDSIWKHPVAVDLVKAGQPEVSVVWTDGPTGLPMKARFDLWVPKARRIVDIKTCRSAKASHLGRSAGELGYHFQMALYWQALQANIGQNPNAPIIIALEKSPPYAVACYEVKESRADGMPGPLAVGKRQVRGALDLLAHCMKTGKWPGYDQGLLELELPPWVGADSWEAAPVEAVEPEMLDKIF